MASRPFELLRTTRALLIVLLINAFAQLVLFSVPELFGRAHDFLTGFTVGLAIASSIGAVIVHGSD